jgi:hypothetical protein
MQCDTGLHGRAPLERRVDAFGWGLFLMALGLIWLAPEAFPDGGLVLALGATLTGLSVLRWVLGLPVSGFLMMLGVGLGLIGLDSAGALSIPLVPGLVLTLGAWMVLRSLTVSSYS